VRASAATIGAIDRISDNQIMMTLTAGDQKLAYVVSTANLMQSVQLAVATLNSNLPATLREIGMM
jgi:hydroxyethylthiazole kinase-like sugar kinase family protein